MERGDVKRELDDMNARMVAAESAVTVLRMEVDGIRTDIDDLGMGTQPSPQYCPPPFPDGRASHGRPEMDTAFKVTIVPEPEPGSGIKGPYWRMYVPGGCVQLDGVPVKVKGPDGKDVEGDEIAISQDGPGDALRCVVYTDKAGTPGARIDAVVSNGYGGPALSDGDVLLADVPLYLFSDYRGYGEMKPNAQVHLGVIALTSHGPCHVDSISDATWSGSLPDGVEYSGMDMTVKYTKTGSGCVDGTNSFTIPILRTKGADFSMDVTDEAVTGTTDHPNGGVKVTLSPSAGQGTNFTVWNGKDGAPGDPGTPGAPGRTGDDGRSVSSVNAGEPVSQDGFTRTPVTFFDNAGNAIGTVDVAAKDGGAGQDQPFTIDMSLVIRYDLSTRQIQARDVTVRNGVVSYGNDWKMITGGQAAAHNSDFN